MPPLSSHAPKPGRRASSHPSGSLSAQRKINLPCEVLARTISFLVGFPPAEPRVTSRHGGHLLCRTSDTRRFRVKPSPAVNHWTTRQAYSDFVLEDRDAMASGRRDIGISERSIAGG